MTVGGAVPLTMDGIELGGTVILFVGEGVRVGAGVPLADMKDGIEVG